MKNRLSISTAYVLNFCILWMCILSVCGCIRKHYEPSEIARKTKDAVVKILTYGDNDTLIGQGTGFFVSENEVVTNRHVIEYGNKVEVLSASHKSFLVTYITGTLKDEDVIKVGVDTRGEKVTPLEISETEPQIGERVVVVGNPLGLEGTVSEGLLSSIREVPRSGNFIQITAPISHGSSGSPVLSMEGYVIGIATMFFAEGQNLNFAISSLDLKEMKPETLLTFSDWRRKIQTELSSRPANEKIRIANIKSSTVWTYNVLKGQIAGGGRMKEKYQYDRMGNEIEIISYDDNGLISGRRATEYDDVAKPVDITYYGKDGEVSKKDIKKYDDKENLVEEISYTYLNNSGLHFPSDSTKTPYAYDENGNLKERVTIDTEGKVLDRMSTSYDDHGREIERSTLQQVDTSYLRMLKESDSFLLRQVKINPQNAGLFRKAMAKNGEARAVTLRKRKTNTKTTYHIDSRGNILEKVENEWDTAGGFQGKRISTFDDFGRRIKITLFDYDSTLISAVTSEYDSFGNMVREVQDVADIDEEIIIYKYDKFGNPLQYSFPEFTKVFRYDYYSE